MKYYEYKQTRETQVTELFNKYEVFFAFSKSQLEEKKKDGVKYYSLDGGMFIPQSNYDLFNDEFKQQDMNFIKKAKELFSPIEIIRYELANHEYCITYDLSDTKDVLEEFNFSDEQYKAAIKDYLLHCEF